MTFEADQTPAVPVRPRSPIAGREQARARAFQRASRHSTMVRALKIGLPILALAAGGLYFLSSGVSVSLGPIDASISRVEVRRDALRMVNPKIEGVTDQGGTFVVRADYADQSVSQPTQITLNAVKAEVNQPGRGWSRLTAPRGTYDSKTEALALLDDIQVTSDSGLKAYLTSAAIDLNKQTVASTEPVRAEMPNGNVRADTLHIDMAKTQLSFDRNVRVHMRRPAEEKPAAPTAPAAASGGLSAFSLNRNAPIDIAAPKLTIYDKDKLAHFTGGVEAAQGDSRMTSRELKVHYIGGGLAGADAGRKDVRTGAKDDAKVRLIEAVDDVHLATANGQQASSRHLVFDAEKQTVLLEHDVVLMRADDVLKGERMIADLATGVSRFEPEGRVKGHFAARGKLPAAGAPHKHIEVGTGQLDLSGAHGKPIDIEANTLTVDDRKRLALFRGDVRALQGDMTMRSRELDVDYSGETKAQDGSSEPQINKITARGRVLITSEAQGQTSTSDWALFDVKGQTVTIGGNVVLSQGKNVIKGDRLVIDLTTGRSRFENEGDLSTGQRVRGLFRPKSSDQKAKGGPGAS